MTNKHANFEQELGKIREKIYNYNIQQGLFDDIGAGHIRDAAVHAMQFQGKSLRPFVLMYSCGAVGGDENTALPAAAAIEIYHTWTLIHDDIIDRDARRRGHETIHEEFRRRAVEEFHFDESESLHYGNSLAILAGDLLQGWSFATMCKLSLERSVNPSVVVALVHQLTTKVQAVLVDGETLDVQYATVPFEDLNEDLILEMLRKKTAVLYQYAAQAGGMIGLNIANTSPNYISSLAAFAERCGIAFQLRDDILGIVGDERALGKPVGSDIREGKKTVISLHALAHANPIQRGVLLQTLGNRRATQEEIQEATRLMIELGGIYRAQQLAQGLVDEAIPHLAILPTTPYKDRLLDWAEYLVAREF